MRSYRIRLPRGLEVDIFDLPEDFKEQVEQAFRAYTTGTTKAWKPIAWMELPERYEEE